MLLSVCFPKPAKEMVGREVGRDIGALHRVVTVTLYRYRDISVPPSGPCTPIKPGTHQQEPSRHRRIQHITRSLKDAKAENDEITNQCWWVQIARVSDIS